MLSIDINVTSTLQKLKESNLFILNSQKSNYSDLAKKNKKTNFAVDLKKIEVTSFLFNT
jgi:hypothetical protein